MMNTKLKKALTTAFPQPAMVFRSVRDLILSDDSYLVQTGWVASSVSGRPIDRQGGPIPWMNTFIVDFLQERLTSTMLTFEFGSGYSTAFYASRTKSVVSVEYDPKWIESLRPNLPDNATIVFQPADVDGEYCRVINRDSTHYDLVVVDGRDRVNCCQQALSSLSETGVLLLDDSSRSRYAGVFNMLKDLGFRQLTFRGPKPCDVGIHSTTIFYRNNNCLSL